MATWHAHEKPSRFYITKIILENVRAGLAWVCLSATGRKAGVRPSPGRVLYSVVPGLGEMASQSLGLSNIFAQIWTVERCAGDTRSGIVQHMSLHTQGPLGRVQRQSERSCDSPFSRAPLHNHLTSAGGTWCELLKATRRIGSARLRYCSSGLI